MANRKQNWQAFVHQVEATRRFPNAILSPPEYGGNIASVSGEVSSTDDHDEIVEMARRKGFFLLAQNLLVLSDPDHDLNSEAKIN